MDTELERAPSFLKVGADSSFDIIFVQTASDPDNKRHAVTMGPSEASSLPG